MLPRANRVVKPADFRTAVKRGRRENSSHAVVYVFNSGVLNNGTERAAHVVPTRFGFIVTKAVGNAVVRNSVRRRLREICRGVLFTVGNGTDIVIRALPGSPEVDFATLRTELTESIGRGVMRR